MQGLRRGRWVTMVKLSDGSYATLILNASTLVEAYGKARVYWKQRGRLT